MVAQASTRADGYTIPLHRHRRGQLLHAITGMMRIETENSMWIVPPARALWVPPELAHEISMRGHVEMRTLYIDPEHCGEPARACRDGGGVAAAARTDPCGARRAGRLRRGDGRGATIAQLILTELERLRHRSLTVPMPRDPRALRIARPLLDNCAIDLDLDDWAERAGASRRTLARLFRGETGISFAEWRARLRTVDGMARIANGASVGEAAASVGYASPSAFSAMVRRSLGKPLRELIRRAEAPAPETIG